MPQLDSTGIQLAHTNRRGWVMERVMANIKTSSTERVRRSRMPLACFLELRPQYPILFSSATHVYSTSVPGTGPGTAVTVIVLKLPFHFPIRVCPSRMEGRGLEIWQPSLMQN